MEIEEDSEEEIEEDSEVEEEETEEDSEVEEEVTEVDLEEDVEVSTKIETDKKATCPDLKEQKKDFDVFFKIFYINYL